MTLTFRLGDKLAQANLHHVHAQGARTMTKKGGFVSEGADERRAKVRLLPQSNPLHSPPAPEATPLATQNEEIPELPQDDLKEDGDAVRADDSAQDPPGNDEDGRPTTVIPPPADLKAQSIRTPVPPSEPNATVAPQAPVSRPSRLPPPPKLSQATHSGAPSVDPNDVKEQQRNVVLELIGAVRGGPVPDLTHHSLLELERILAEAERERAERIDQIEAVCQQITREIAQAEARKNSLVETRSQLNAENRGLQTQTDDLMSAKAALTATRDALAGERDELTRAIELVKSSIAEKRTEHERLLEERDTTHTQQLAEVERQRKRHEEERNTHIGQLEHDIAQLDGRIEKLKVAKTEKISVENDELEAVAQQRADAKYAQLAEKNKPGRMRKVFTSPRYSGAMSVIALLAILLAIYAFARDDQAAELQATHSSTESVTVTKTEITEGPTVENAAAAEAEAEAPPPPPSDNRMSMDFFQENVTATTGTINGREAIVLTHKNGAIFHCDTTVKPVEGKPHLLNYRCERFSD